MPKEEEGLPRCACGDYTLDGKATCGRAVCSVRAFVERGQRAQTAVDELGVLHGLLTIDGTRIVVRRVGAMFRLELLPVGSAGVTLSRSDLLALVDVLGRASEGG